MVETVSMHVKVSATYDIITLICLDVGQIQPPVHHPHKVYNSEHLCNEHVWLSPPMCMVLLLYTIKKKKLGYQ